MTTITYGITMQMVALSPLYAHSHCGISGCHAMLIHNMPPSFLIFRSPCQCLLFMVIKYTLCIQKKILVKLLHSEATSSCEFAPPNYAQKGLFIMVTGKALNIYNFFLVSNACTVSEHFHVYFFISMYQQY